jgi:hypothetical protein
VRVERNSEDALAAVREHIEQYMRAAIVDLIAEAGETVSPELLDAIVAKCMRQVEPAVDQEFVRWWGRDSMH